MARGAARRVSTSALLRLLREGEPEEMCAASLVLGRLRPPDRRVIPALARALHLAPVHLKPYLLDSLSRFREPRAVRHLVPYLLVEGSLREQAVHLLTRYGPQVLAELRRLHARGGSPLLVTLVRVVGEIPGKEALDYLMDLLPGAGFELAKSIGGVLRRRADQLRPAERRHVLQRLLKFLKGPEGTANTTAEIAALKILGALREPAALNLLLDRCRPERAAIIRQNAVDALALIPIPGRRAGPVIRRLRPLLLQARDRPGIAAGILQVLRPLGPQALDVATVVELAHSPFGEVARAALLQLRHFPPRQVMDTLVDALVQESPALQEAAAESLRCLPLPADALAQVCGDARLAGKQDRLRSVLESRREVIPPARFRQLLRALLDGVEDSEVMSQRLMILAAVDRIALNRVLERRAAVALRGDQAPRVRALLEPLVRGRLATPRGRYLLALAHLLLAGVGRHPDPAHLERALQLLGPLSRLRQWSLRSRLLRESLVPPSLMKAVADHMARRPEPERSLAAALHRRLEASGALPR